jgi:hypothetical protein
MGNYLKFKDIVSRVSGVSTKIGGIQWQPAKSELATTKSIVNFLEDRRVLYNPAELEMPHHCVSSIIEIRHFLTSEIDGLKDGSRLKLNLKIMRAACRRFLDSSSLPDGRYHNSYTDWVFFSNLGELRGVFGLCLREIVLACQIDVESNLASIIPNED